MAELLHENIDRNEAHQFQARVIADGTAPFACCTEHVERGDTTIVWSDTPTPQDLAALARRPRL